MRTIRTTLLAATVLACVFTLAAAQQRGAPEAGVVKITATVEGRRKTGTGFIVRLEQDIAYIVTAAHVVEGDKAPEVEFHSSRGRTFKAKVQQLESESPRGLALLLIERPPGEAAALAIGAANAVKVRDEVEAIGFPQGGGAWAVILTRVTSREGSEWVLSGQIDEGNSGGPMLADGEVVGVVTRVQNGFGRANTVALLRDVLEGWGVVAAAGAPGQPDSAQQQAPLVPARASSAPSRKVKGARRLATFTGHQAPVTDLAFSPSGKALASSSADGTLILWDTTARRASGAPLKQQKGVLGLAFGSEGTLASSGGGKDSSIVLWDVVARKALGRPLADDSCRGGIWGIAFSPDGKTLAAACENDTVLLWDPAKHAPLGGFGTDCDAPLRPTFSPDGGTLAVGTTDACIVLWNVRTRTLLGSLSERINAAWVLAVAFGPQGKTLASASTTKGSEVLIWDLVSRRILGEPLIGHTKPVMSLAFNPEGTTLVSGSDDQTLMLWDMATHQAVGEPLRAHTGGVMKVAFSPDGKTIASAGADKTVILWEVEYR